MKHWKKGLALGAAVSGGVALSLRLAYPKVAPGLRLAGWVGKRLTAAKTETELRERNAHYLGPKPKLRQTRWMRSERVAVTRPDGTVLSGVLFRPRDVRPNATGVLFLHGGGFVGGFAEDSFKQAARLIRASNTVVFAPSYRLAVEAPYPAALEDAATALRYLRDHAAWWQVNPDQLMVMGVSAGGGLAAALTLYERETKDVAIAAQFPLYPMLHDRMFTAGALHNHGFVWDSVRNRLGWQLYLGALADAGVNVPATAAPGRTTDYRGLPPFYSFIGDQDGFLDETRAYVKGLREAGVPATLTVYPGGYHAFEVLAPFAPLARRAQREFMRAYEQAVARDFAPQARDETAPPLSLAKVDRLAAERPPELSLFNFLFDIASRLPSRLPLGDLGTLIKHDNQRT